MALHDLTPQLRTRLSRLERVVGLFVAVAIVLLLAGLAYYVYRVAERKGWFVQKMPYFTFVDNAGGLRVGDPVRLMGFDVGEITAITAQPPFNYFDVYVAFVVKEEFVGYLWDDSRAIVASTDLLGKRSIEVTKGTNGPPTYLFHPVRTVPARDVETLRSNEHVRLAQGIYDGAGKELLAPAYRPINSLEPAALAAIQAQATDIQIFDDTVKTKAPAAVWDYENGRYRLFPMKDEKGFFLPPREAPALARRLEALADTVEAALPSVLSLTNRLNRVLDQATDTAHNADRLLTDARPLLSHLTQIGANLTNAQGSLGEWALTPDLRHELTQTLANARQLLANSDQHLDGLSANANTALTNVTTVLLQLTALTSNLNSQVIANSNMLSEISTAVTNADSLMQGLKRHWLLRSAFKEKKEPKKSGR